VSRKYLVTGGLGFIGSSLTKGLVQKGYTVRVLDNSSRGSKEKLGDTANDVEIIEGDIRDADTVRSALEGMDGVCHLAFINGTKYFYEKPALVLEVGVKGMVNVLDGCINNNVEELILASSSEVYQTPPSVPTDETAPLSVPDLLNPRYSYGGGKIISELLAINYGREYFKNTLIFRPHNVYGPDMGWEHVIPNFVERMVKLKNENPNIKTLDFPIQGDGGDTRAFIYINDFTEGLIQMIESGENMNVYHIGTSDEIAIAQLAHKVAETMSVKINIVPGDKPKGATPRRCPDISKMEKLGFKPKYSLDDGLKETVPWYESRAEARIYQ